jgi:hypothetical protein
MDWDPEDTSRDRTERDVRTATERYHRRGEQGNRGQNERAGLASLEHDNATDEQRERRRCSLLEEAVREGIPSDVAEVLYDIALEEGLDPPIALELVRTGLAVNSPTESESLDPPVTDRYLPTWIFPATDPDTIRRERSMRVSFRRLRGFLEAERNVESAFRRFAAESDVGYFGY